MRQLIILALIAALASCKTSSDSSFDTVQYVVNSYEHLAPPITAVETTTLRSGFDWNATTPLAEVDEEGNRALHYALILVDSAETADLLRLSGIYFDPMPLFPEELQRWDGQQGVISFEGDDAGTFVYAFVPAAVYNRARSLAIANAPVIPAIVLRDPPERVTRLASGALAYTDLVDQGFRGIAPSDAARGAVVTPSETSSTLVDAFRRETNAVRADVDAIRDPIESTRALAIRLRLYNTDRDFSFPDTNVSRDRDGFFDEDRNLLVRVWGSAEQRGQMLSIEGAQVLVADNLGIAHSSLDANNYATFSVPQDDRPDARVRVFADLQNQAATLTGQGLFADRAKLFDRRMDSGDQDVGIEVDACDTALEVLAQMTDAWRYAADVLRFAPPPAIVHAAPAAGPEVIPDFMNWNTACLSLVASANVDAFASSEIGEQSWENAHVALPPGTYFRAPDIDVSTRVRSRSVPTLEYAQFIWCALMNDAPGRLLQVGAQTIPGTVPDTLGRPSTLMRESFAELVSSQVAGGVVGFGVERLVSESWDATGSYCDARRQGIEQVPCIDDNIGGPFGAFPMGQGVEDRFVAGEFAGALVLARLTTILVDFLDGHPGAPTADEPGNGTSWASIPITPLNGPRLWFGPSIESSEAIDPTFDDEAVHLTGPTLREAIDLWWKRSHEWSAPSFIGALTDVARAAGSSDAEVCALLSNHSLSLSCSDLVGELSALDDLPRVPPTNLVIAVTHPAPSSALEWTMTYFDPSYASAVETAVIAEANDAPLFVEERIPWSRDARATSYAGIGALPFDEEVTFLVRAVATTVNPGTPWVRSLAMRTPAQPVGALTVTPASLGLEVDWAATSATEYEVRLTPQSTQIEATLGRTALSAFSIGGLSDAETYIVRVIAVNGDDVLSTHAAVSAVAQPLP